MMESVSFLTKFIRSPSTIGSVIPSSPALVASMMSVIEWEHANVIVELGAGTGVVTRAINDKRHDQSIFFSFEKEDQMNLALKYNYPDVIICDEAFKLTEVLAQNACVQVDCVVSCLPFANFRRVQQLDLLSAIHAALRPGGLFIAFQYSLQLQANLKARYAEVDCRFIMKNFPPAFLYICKKEMN